MGPYQQLYQRLLLPAYERLVKRRSRLTYQALLERSQWWPPEELEAFQQRELSALLGHAAEQVPYWQRVFRERGLQSEAIKTPEDFRRLPILTKDEIRAHRTELVARDWVGRAWTKATGGSTGVPLEFAYTPESDDWRIAASRRGYAWAGCEEGTKQAYVWGTAIGPVPWPKRLKEALHHRVLRQRYFNCFEFDEPRMAACLDTLRRWRPAILVGYTNPLYEFARFAARRGGAAVRPRVAITGAEKLHEFQREMIREAFGCPVFNTYGSREFMLIAAECDRHQGLHVAAENLLVELIREDGRPAAPGELGRVVITDLHNLAMPFIRYEIGDLAVAAEGACPCGRGLPRLADVVGRSLDMLRTPGGRRVPGEFFPHLMKEFRWVKRFQVVQDRLDHLTVKIIRNGGFDQAQGAFMEQEIRKTMGPQVAVDIRFVENIPLTRTGKLRVTVCEISNDSGNHR